MSRDVVRSVTAWVGAGMERTTIRRLLLVCVLAAGFLMGNSFPGGPAGKVMAAQLEARPDGPQGFDCATVTDIPQAECEALVALYTSAWGQRWTNKAGWLDSPFACSWFGITCMDGHVTQLGLQNNYLDGVLPPQIGDLSALEHLDLSSNYLRDVIPPEIGKLTALSWLSLYTNYLTGPLPATLGNLRSLYYLDLGLNGITGPVPPELGNLSGLGWLCLEVNQLSGPIPRELSQLSNLTVLDLSENQLSGEIPRQLAQLSALEHLWLASNQLTGPIPPELGALTAIANFNLRRNQLTGPIPAELGRLTLAWRFDLSENGLAGPIPPELGNLASVMYLFLNNNHLSGPIPPELGDLAALQHHNAPARTMPQPVPTHQSAPAGKLALSTYHGLVGIDRPPPNTYTVDLASNQLSGSIPAALSKLQVTGLDLSGNQLEGFVPELGTAGSFWQNLDYNKLLYWGRTHQTRAPDALRAEGAASTISLTWTPIEYVEDGGYYEVSYAAGAGGPWIVHGHTQDKTASNYDLVELPEGSACYFRLRTFTPAHSYSLRAYWFRSKPWYQQNDLWSDYSAVVSGDLPQCPHRTWLPLLIGQSLSEVIKAGP